MEGFCILFNITCAFLNGSFMVEQMFNHHDCGGQLSWCFSTYRLFLSDCDRLCVSISRDTFCLGTFSGGSSAYTF